MCIRDSIWWKDCKNRFTISWNIWLNMPVFCHVVKKYTNEPRFLWSYWTKVQEMFTRYRGITCAVNAPIEVAISHSILDWQNDECRGVGNFAPFLPLNWLPWQRPLRYWKKLRSVICTQNAFIWWKDCKNRFTISWDIWLNMPVFCHVVKKVYKWAPFSLELLDQSSRNFYTI